MAAGVSVRIMTLAWSVDLSAGDKLVLLALADCANDDGLCWPGMRSLSDKTGKCERSIQASVKALVKGGHLTREEVIGKGCYYTVHPVPASGMQGYEPPLHHYVYRVTKVSTGEFYVGARSCHCDPSVDSYMGSGNWVKEQVRLGVELSKEIIEVYPSREALAVGEQKHTGEFFGTALCRNAKKATPGTLTKQYTPAEIAPRRNCPPQEQTPTPAKIAGKPSRTIIGSVAKATSPARAMKIDPFPMPEGVNPEHWRDFLANRKAKKLRNSPTAHKCLLDDLARLSSDEWPPGRLIELAAAKGWGGIYLPREQTHNGRPDNSLDALFAGL